jgi:sugar O-acyltransferase (sialic acid O-acetyltransferase NeuD family)
MNQGSRKLCAIVGAGGHACVLIDALQSQASEFDFVVLDSDKKLHGQKLLGVPILGDDSLLPDLRQRGEVRFVVGVGGIGNTAPRRRLYEMALDAGLLPQRVLHRAAICSPTAVLCEGVQLLAGSIVNTGATIGTNTIVNTRAVIEHGCRIGDHVHVASSATLCGDVVVGEGAHIGAGATIRQGISIGRGAVVGAGAVVIKDVPAGVVAVGVPARHLGSGETGNAA